MNYKEMIICLIEMIDDEKLLKSLFYIMQKIIGRDD